MAISQENDLVLSKNFESLEFCKWFISQHMKMLGPDPLTQDWRPIPGFPRYFINRCGEVMNDRGYILAPQTATIKGRTFDRVCIYRENVQYFRGMDGLLKEAFKEDYI